MSNPKESPAFRCGEKAKNLVWREAHNDDLGEMVRVLERAIEGWAVKPDGYDNLSLTKLWSSNLLGSEFRNHVVFENGFMVGWASWKETDTGTHLCGLWVIPERVGTGIGHALVGKIIEDAHDYGSSMTLRVWAFNEHAIRFYEQHGWVKQSVVLISGLAKLVMVRDLK